MWFSIAPIIIGSFLFNLVSMAQMSVIPVLMPETAGIAFSCFLVSKIIFLYFAGKITTKLGSPQAFRLSIAIEVLALGFEGFFPQALLFGRCLEGTALALGMVTSFTWLREVHRSEGGLEKSVAKIMTVSGIAVLVGPWIGSFAADEHPKTFLWVSSAVYLLFLIYLNYFRPFERTLASLPDAKAPVRLTNQKHKTEKNWPAMIALAATHAIGVGLQPLVSWWGKNLFIAKTHGASITFGVVGLGFVLGTFLRVKNHRVSYLIGAIGIAGIELSIHFTAFFPVWLVAVFGMGFWYANRSRALTAHLGWESAAHYGEDQAVWLFWTGLPSALVPMVIWSIKEPEALAIRIPIIALVTCLSFIGYMEFGRRST